MKIRKYAAPVVKEFKQHQQKNRYYILMIMDIKNNMSHST